MSILVDCSNCRTPLQLPVGAWLINCTICRAYTSVADHNNHYMPPPAQFHSFGLTPVNERKRAVICGISYTRTTTNVTKLKGCINDAKRMKYLLMNKFKFPESSIFMLTEEETNPYRIPTKHNIRMAMCWLVQGCRIGDSLVFYFSGHGSRQRNYSGDEIDETLVPMDVETEGVIVDDEINATMVQSLPHGVRLHAVIDACHSGTMLDLSFLCKMDRNGRYTWEDHIPPSGIFKGTNGGEVISFSGCDDNQLSAETRGTGRMTSSFIHAIESGHGTTYGDMLTSMRATIRREESLAGDDRRQEPQLTASEPFDVYTKRFFL